MIREKAIEEMKKGEKITHRFFLENEFITMKDDMIVDENDYKLDPEEFWSFRNDIIWEDGWGIYKQV